MTRVFVYGTLRRGFGNHRLLAGARFLGEARTARAYRMVSLGGCPGMLAGTSRVVGEVYEVDDETLLRLDRLEGHPYMYRREPVRLHGFAKVEAYIYQRDSARLPEVASGDWAQQGENDHAD